MWNLNSQLLLEKQVAVVARKAVAHRWVVCRLCLFLDWEALLIIIHPFVTSCLDYCNEFYMVAALEETSTGAKCDCMGNKWCWLHGVTPLLSELHCLPVCLQVQTPLKSYMVWNQVT